MKILKKSKEKFINFFKNSGQFLIQFNNLEAIIKQFTTLIMDFSVKKSKKSIKKEIHEFFKTSGQSLTNFDNLGTIIN